MQILEYQAENIEGKSAYVIVDESGFAYLVGKLGEWLNKESPRDNIFAFKMELEGVCGRALTLRKAFDMDWNEISLDEVDERFK